MKDSDKSKEQLIEELNGLREKIAALEREKSKPAGRLLPIDATFEHDIDQSKTETILVDKLLDTKEVFRDSEDEFEFAPVESKTEFIILDKLFEQQKKNLPRAIRI